MPRAGIPFDNSIRANLPEEGSREELIRQTLILITEAHPDITTVHEVVELRTIKEKELNNNPNDTDLAVVLELIALEEYLRYTQPELEGSDIFEKAAHGGNALSFARVSSYADMGAPFIKKSLDDEAVTLFKSALQRVKSEVQNPTIAFSSYIEGSITALE